VCIEKWPSGRLDPGVRGSGDSFVEALQQARLTDPGLTDNQDYLTLTVEGTFPTRFCAQCASPLDSRGALCFESLPLGLESGSREPCLRLRCCALFASKSRQHQPCLMK
jgi:hypothetical protein